MQNTTQLRLQHLINHIAFVLDRSGSMRQHIPSLTKVFDNQIEYLKRRSIELNQETRVSIYSFDNIIECLVFDMDVMRVPSLSGQIYAGGQTALLDATNKALTDMSKLPEIYGDHAFLIYVLTDGEENYSKEIRLPGVLSDKIAKLSENWTVACLVPAAHSVFEAKKAGFPSMNIQVWTVDDAGWKEVEKSTTRAMDNYMTLRSQGVKSTKNLFATDLSNVSTKSVATKLQELAPAAYTIFFQRSKDKVAIKPFVEQWMGADSYRIGSAYYELTKPEEIQGSKEICLQNRKNGKVYSGKQARDILGLPSYTLKVAPGDHGDWRIFVQSTSINRNIMKDTQVLVMK